MALREFTTGAEQIAFARALHKKWYTLAGPPDPPPSPSEPEPEPEPEPTARPYRKRTKSAHELSLEYLANNPSSRTPGLQPVPGLPNRNVEQVIRAVCDFYDVSEDDLVSRRRRFSWIRHVVIYIARVMTLKSSPHIGRRLGKLDHSTVLHGYHAIKARRETDAQLRDDLTKIIEVLTSPTQEAPM